MNEDRDRIEQAIRSWWSGGGTTRRIIDILEREAASLVESRFVAQRLAAAADRLGVISESIIESELEKARAFHARTPMPVAREHDSANCTFVDGVECPNCREYGDRVIHGHLLDPEEVLARIAEVRDLLVARMEETAQA